MKAPLLSPSFASLLAATFFLSPALARADEPAPAPAPAPVEEGEKTETVEKAAQSEKAVTPERTEKENDDGPPPAWTGVQFAFRAGYAVPSGSASAADDDDISRIYGGEVPLVLDLGFKATKSVFIGLYGGLGVGGTGGSDFDRGCSQSGIRCAQTSARVGAQVQYNFAPSDRLNPWIGYGVGYESTSMSASNGSASVRWRTSGPEFARLMVGLDVRTAHNLGIGPYADFAIAQYSTFSGPDSTGVVREFDLKSALHQWFSIGVRMVVNP